MDADNLVPEYREIRRRWPWTKPRRIEVYPRLPPGVAMLGTMAARLEGQAPLRIGMRSPWHSDVYHEMLVLSWWRFLLYGMSIYLLLNVMFAGLYLIEPQAIDKARPGSIGDAFFFSVQTMATIGYGVMTPANTYANVIMTAETLVSLLFITFFTGATFARFSRPTARVSFSQVVTVSPYNGISTLAVRMTNARRNQILEADVSITLLRNEYSVEGLGMRRFYDLKLARAHTPIFALSFTAMHPIDTDSPLHGATLASMVAEDAELLVTVTGLDGTMTQTIHARTSYKADEVRFDARFVDMFGFTAAGRVVIDLTKFDEVQPLAGQT